MLGSEISKIQFTFLQIISIVKRKWNQHWLMYGSGRRKHRCSSTHYTVTENMADTDCHKKVCLTTGITR